MLQQLLPSILSSLKKSARRRMEFHQRNNPLHPSEKHRLENFSGIGILVWLPSLSRFWFRFPGSVLHVQGSNYVKTTNIRSSHVPPGLCHPRVVVLCQG